VRNPNRRAAEARTRGERIRAELIEKLIDGPQEAAALYPQIDGDASLEEIVFQLERLSEEGRAVGESEGAYKLSPTQPPLDPTRSQGCQGLAKRS
jgi:hypothetical protein